MTTLQEKLTKRHNPKESLMNTPKTAATITQAGGGQLPSYTNFNLSEEKARFAAMLLRYPAIYPLWDLENEIIHKERFEHALTVFSHGERIMAEFFAGCWFGDNRYNFNLFEAAKVLDSQALTDIEDWVHDPVFP